MTLRLRYFCNIIFFNLKALPCTLNYPCQNNGVCSNDMEGGYVCSCKKGYMGDNCEISKIAYMI